MRATADRPAAATATRRVLTGCLLALVLTGCASTMSGTVPGPVPAPAPYCDYTPAATSERFVPGLIVGADVLSSEGHRADRGVHIRFNGSIGAVAEFETLRAAYPDSAVLDCRGRAVVSPGFVNAHEHPAYS